ncbi:MAG: hypothetical protein EPO21_18985 [Chloroflexota bacterium]|nr:MAG: hypothetical protein EPO21_18985 [Chloroflexota bacterium]
MYDRESLAEQLRTLLEALERIPRRFADITTPDDFYARFESWFPSQHSHQRNRMQMRFFHFAGPSGEVRRR